MRMHLTKTQQREAFKRMLRVRQFEEAAAMQVRAGRIPGIHSSVGQEATVVGACLALQNGDAMTGTHRSHGHPIAMGADLNPLMAELMGKATGVCKGRGGSMHLADIKVGIISESAIVGGGIPLATGSGLSAKVRGTKQVTLCFFGDGAVNQGTFHESLNMAALWKLPVVYLCENNGYAISTSLVRSHSDPNIAKKAQSYGMSGRVVDGQNISAVYDAVSEAVSQARLGHGPTLIEAKTYRFDEHCMNLFVPKPYRSVEEVQEYKLHRDPIVLYRASLLEAGWSAAELNAIEQQVTEEVSEAIHFAVESSFPEPETLFDDLYSDPIGS